MLELAAQLRPGWTSATEIVQLNGAISRSARPTRYQEVVERFGTTSGAAIRLMAAPAIVGSAELRRALEADPAVGETLAAARRAPSAVFGMGVLGPESVHVASGYLDDADLADLQRAGAVGDVLGRFLDPRRAASRCPPSTNAPSACRSTNSAPSPSPWAWPRARDAARSRWLRCAPGCLRSARHGRGHRRLGAGPWLSRGHPPPTRSGPWSARIVDATLARQTRAGDPDPCRTARAHQRAAGPRQAHPVAVAIAIGADHGGWQLKDTIARRWPRPATPSTTAARTVPTPSTTRTSPTPWPASWPTGPAAGASSSTAPASARAMVANKVPGVRAAICHDLSSARNSREHNHANVLTLGARFIGEGLALEIVRAWLGTPWGPGRHADAGREDHRGRAPLHR